MGASTKIGRILVQNARWPQPYWRDKNKRKDFGKNESERKRIVFGVV